MAGTVRNEVDGDSVAVGPAGLARGRSPLRQLNILEGLADGLTVAGVAERLVISQNTARN
ncbi:MAG: hypothetical protein M3O34_04715 [Chloroflexota bacterium]|nr:hypothetical protein [Chloroflexota bacterium]